MWPLNLPSFCRVADHFLDIALYARSLLTLCWAPPINRCSIPHYATKEFAEALKRANIHAHVKYYPGKSHTGTRVLLEANGLVLSSPHSVAAFPQLLSDFECTLW